jgi:hypothetical protein
MFRMCAVAKLLPASSLLSTVAILPLSSGLQEDITTMTKEQIDAIVSTCSIKEMLTNYKLTAEFCVKYILSTDDYAASVEDSYYDTKDVLAYQPHITYDELARYVSQDDPSHVSL